MGRALVLWAVVGSSPTVTAWRIYSTQCFPGLVTLGRNCFLEVFFTWKYIKIIYIFYFFNYFDTSTLKQLKKNTNLKLKQFNNFRDCGWIVIPNNTVVFAIMIDVAFQNIFCLKIYQDHVFYFNKIYF